jgi:hypothetical protein
MKNTGAAKIKFADPLTDWTTPREHKGHPFQCKCATCEAQWKWTQGYLKHIAKVDR